MEAGRNGRGVVAALCLTSFGPLSFGLGCAGVFYPALSASLGVSPGLLSYYTSALWIAALVTLPVLAKLFERIGARACVTTACALVALDLAALSFTGGFVWFMACGCVMGVAVAVLLFLAPSTLVNEWFARRAGLLLGVVTAFAGIGGVVWCAVGGVLIELWGWQAAYRVFCVLAVLLGAFPSLLLVTDAPGIGGRMPSDEAGGCSVDGREGPARLEDGACGDADGAAEPAPPAGRHARSVHLDAHRHPYLPYRREDGSIAPAAPVSQLKPSVAARVASLRKGIAAPLPRCRGEVPQGPAGHPLPTEVGVPAKRALPSGLLLLIADIAFILNFGMYVYFVIPSFADGLPIAASFPLLGALASSAAMAGQTVSKVALGFVGDRAPAAATIIGIVAGLAGIATLWFFRAQAPAVLLGALLIGACCGVANVMMPVFTRLAFGMRDYPRIYARVSMAASLGAIASGFLWGTVIGVKGGYVELFAGVSILLAVALWLVAVLSRRLRRHGVR